MGDTDGGTDGGTADGGDAAGDATLVELGALRVGEEVAARRRRRALADADALAATLHGVLTDLAEAGAEVVIETAAGSRRLRLDGAGLDFVSGVATNRSVAIPIDAVSAVRTVGRAGAPGGERSAPSDLALDELLSERVGDEVAIALDTGPTVSGTLQAVGDDVLTLRVPTTPPATVYVAIASVESVTLS